MCKFSCKKRPTVNLILATGKNKTKQGDNFSSYFAAQQSEALRAFDTAGMWMWAEGGPSSPDLFECRVVGQSLCQQPQSICSEPVID